MIKKTFPSGYLCERSEMCDEIRPRYKFGPNSDFVPQLSGMGALESLFDRNSDKCPGSLEQNTCTHRSHTDCAATAGYRWIFVQEI